MKRKIYVAVIPQAKLAKLWGIKHEYVGMLPSPCYVRVNKPVLGERFSVSQIGGGMVYCQKELLDNPELFNIVNL